MIRHIKNLKIKHINNFVLILFILILFISILSSCEKKKFESQDVKDIIKVTLEKLSNDEKCYVSNRFACCLHREISDYDRLMSLTVFPYKGYKVTKENTEKMQNNNKLILERNDIKSYVTNIENIIFFDAESYYKTKNKEKYYIDSFDGFLEITTPYIYSADGIVLIGFTFTGERDCSGGTLILIKKKGKWVVYGKSSLWVS